MNRAAIADAAETGVPSAAIDTAVRQEMVAMITTIMGQLVACGRLRADTDPLLATEAYISLLFGEMPMQQALGLRGPLYSGAIKERSDRALDQAIRLFSKTSADPTADSVRYKLSHVPAIGRSGRQ